MMTAFSDAFRTEVSRVARKEIKAELEVLRKAAAAQRAEIVALKQEIKKLASDLKTARRDMVRAGANEKAASQAAEEAAPKASRFKFNAQMLVAKRKKLGISQQAMAVLLEASTLSVSRWESGKVMPRAAQLERLQAILKMGKREAMARLRA
ncbi:helix-turn-helix domain-containing protein [Comamonas sp. w2-DMI]|uniref:helix-turn-helix domain-containing protein n=1 Tax=Comamonas sp. w2-DMI TaxID=3126391 RepID=UPI0032E40494